MKRPYWCILLLAFASSGTILAQETPKWDLEETDATYMESGDVDSSGIRRGLDGSPDIPDRFFFRNGIDITVLDQSTLPACVGYAIAGAVGIRLNWFCRRTCSCRGKLPPFSALYIFNQIYRGDGKGITLAAGLDTLRAQGICLNDDFRTDPHNPNVKPPDTAVQAARKFQFWNKRERIFFLPTEMSDADQRHALMLDLLRSHLSAGLPVIAGLRCPDDFFQFKGDRYHPVEVLPEKANHAVVIMMIFATWSGMGM